MTRESEVVYNYVEEVDPNLTCAICQSALVDPVTTASCKHTFCRDCITRALKHNPSCPIDRSALTTSSLQDTEPLVQLMLDELQVKCEAQDCGKVMQRGLLLAHLRSCSRAIVTCGDDQCGISMARHRMPHHRAYECFHRRMECNRCGVVVTFKEHREGKHISCCGSAHPEGECSADKCDYCGDPFTTSAAHHRWTCPKAPVACTHTARGCTSIVPRDELEKHLSSCVFETLSGFFAANDARFKAMEKRHEELVAENDALRSQLWNLRRGMTIPRGLWGDDHDGINWPTPEPELDPPSPRSPPPPLPPLPSAIPIPVRPVTDADPDATPTASSSTFTARAPPSNASTSVPNEGISVSTTTVTTSSSASSPPPPLPTPLAHTARLAHPPLTPPPRMSYTDWVLQRLPPPRMYGSEPCAALRASVIHLAAGLDAAERRSEVRTMTESLRIQEEVATLRAIVRPMRMQVLAERPGSPQVARFAQGSLMQATPPPTQQGQSGELLTPPLSTSHSLMGHDTSDSEDDEHLASLSIRESVVFSAQDVHPRSSQSSLVATATATPARMPAREWTGRPCAFPPPSPEPQNQHRGSGSSASGSSRLGSLGARLGASLLGMRDATPRL